MSGNLTVYIPVQGATIEEKYRPTLARCQKYVGGYVTPVHLNFRGHKAVMYVDEEGLIHRQQKNPIASAIAGQLIVGPAVVLVGWRAPA